MREIKCLMCEKPLTGRLDTFGEVGFEVCADCNAEMEREAENAADVGYGFFPGGDPRDFTPDYELCSADEIAAWEADCAAWNQGNGQPCPSCCTHVQLDDGTEMHVLAPRYGIGTYIYRGEY